LGEDDSRTTIGLPTVECSKNATTTVDATVATTTSVSANSNKC